MKYIGNKARLLDFIDSVVSKEKLPKGGIFIDIFTGTTNVAKYYKKRGYRIISNDFMTYSYSIQNAYIKNNSYPAFNKLVKSENILASGQYISSKKDPLSLVIKFLNTLHGEKGFIYNNYAPAGKDKRQYFSNDNAMKIDAIRNKIEYWKTNDLITQDEFYILLSSLIDASDFVANMSGTYGAYLKIWRSMALKPLTLLVPELIESNEKNLVYKLDSNILIKRIKGGILYIDPPYNSRQYAPNFHILETISCWDNPKIEGKTGLRPYQNQKSAYSQKKEASKAFADLISHADVDYILLSYSNEGIIPEGFILDVLGKRGKVKIYKKEYRRFRTERNHEKRHYRVPDDKVTEIIYFVKVINK